MGPRTLIDCVWTRGWSGRGAGCCPLAAGTQITAAASISTVRLIASPPKKSGQAKRAESRPVRDEVGPARHETSYSGKKGAGFTAHDGGDHPNTNAAGRFGIALCLCRGMLRWDVL